MFAGISYFIKICWHYNKKYLAYLSANQILKVCLMLVNLFLPQFILDAVFTENNVNKGFQIVVVYVSCIAILGIIINSLARLSNNARTYTFHHFQLDLGKYMANVGFETLESKHFLSLKAKAQQYLYGGGQGFASVLENGFEIFGCVATLGVYAFIIFQLNGIMLFLLFILILINTLFNWKIQKDNVGINLEKAEHERKSNYYSNLFQDYVYGKEIRVNNLCEWLIKKYDNQLSLMQTFYVKLNRNNCTFSQIALILGTLQQLITYLYLFWVMLKRQMTVGEFSLYLNTIMSFSTSLKKLVNQVINIRQYTTYFDAFCKYTGNVDITAIRGNNCIKGQKINSVNKFSIVFKNVSFKYPQNTYYSLQDINVTITEGDKIAIVGKNGAGKSTFIKLLLKIYTPTSGEILLNGVNINMIDDQEYKNFFSAVFQDFILFSETLEENIVLNNKMDSKKFKAILEKINFINKVEKLPKKEHTNVYKLFDDKGYIPSGGEMQKIAIARALYRDARIFILDEPSSSMDPQAEYELYQIFNSLVVDKTCLFISHRLAITTFCNKILVFDDAKIAEEGDHKTLLEKEGLYYDMYSKQTEYYHM